MAKKPAYTKAQLKDAAIKLGDPNSTKKQLTDASIKMNTAQGKK